MVVNRIEEALNISLNYSRDSLSGSNGLEGRVAAPSGAETMRGVEKFWFQHGL
jgi:hypothetical protein